MSEYKDYLLSLVWRKAQDNEKDELVSLNGIRIA